MMQKQSQMRQDNQIWFNLHHILSKGKLITPLFHLKKKSKETVDFL